jgi:hypothetical protein
VAELPVVTVWPTAGPLLRTRRNRPVFAFWIVDRPEELLTFHRWLVKPLPLFPARSSVTSAPAVEARRRPYLRR